MNPQVDLFITHIHNAFKINKGELYKLWDKVSSKDLNKLSKNEIKRLCIENNLDSTGVKKTLIERLQSIDYKSNIMMNNQIIIKKNKYGNYEHEETHFIFNKDTHTVIGVQNDNGDVSPLKIEDINVCNKYQFEYKHPDNLYDDADASSENEHDMNESEDNSSDNMDTSSGDEDSDSS